MADTSPEPPPPEYTSPEEKVEELFHLLHESLSVRTHLPGEVESSKDLTFLRGSSEEVGCVQIGVEDGYINYIYRLGRLERDGGDGQTVVVKWARKRARIAEEKKMPMPEENEANRVEMLKRNVRECRALLKAGRLVPGFTPDIYWLDTSRFFFIMRDLHQHRSFRQILTAGDVNLEDFGKIATFFATLHRKTQLSKMSREEEEEWRSVGAPPTVLEQMKTHMFSKIFDPVNPMLAVREYSQVMKDSGVVSQIIGDAQVKATLDRMAEALGSIQVCILHNDSHPGAIMIDWQHDISFLDWEFTAFGNPAKEIGYALGEVVCFYYVYQGRGTAGLPQRLVEATRHYLTTYLESCDHQALIPDQESFWKLVTAHAGHFAGVRAVGVLRLEQFVGLEQAEVECARAAARLMKQMDEGTSMEDFLSLAFK